MWLSRFRIGLFSRVEIKSCEHYCVEQILFLRRRVILSRSRVLYVFLYMSCASIEVSAEHIALTVPEVHLF